MSSVNAESFHVWPRLAIFGCMRRLFFIRQTLPSSRYTVEYCRSITLEASFPGRPRSLGV